MERDQPWEGLLMALQEYPHDPTRIHQIRIAYELWCCFECQRWEYEESLKSFGERDRLRLFNTYENVATERLRLVARHEGLETTDLMLGNAAALISRTSQEWTENARRIALECGRLPELETDLLKIARVMGS